MPLIDVHHVALRCEPGNLDKTIKFYKDVLGMKSAARPELGFDGAWLDINKTMFHLVDHFPPEHLDPWHKRAQAKSIFDHIAIKANGFDAMKAKFIEQGVDWRQLNLSSAGLWQLFVLDPNGIIVELNFTIADEPKGSIGPDGSKPYVMIESYAGGHADQRGGNAKSGAEAAR
jgi:catechol 2,3-dioxygenase-like lactoylglutathione lyase family enzyme